MINKISSFLIILLLSSHLYSASEDSTKNEFHVEKADSTLLSDKLLTPPKKYSPLKSMALSAIVPGAGQFYCGRKTRGGVFLGSELIIAAFAANRYFIQYDEAQKNYINGFSDYYYIQDQFNTHKTLNDSTDTTFNTLYGNLYNFYEKQLHARTKRKNYHHFVGWGAGIYITNILDALASSNYFYDDKPRKPGLAAGLSAIPCLGLGQIYNGSFQKTGLLLTTQTMLLYMAIDKQILANYCLDKRDEIREINSNKNFNFTLNSNWETNWTDKYNGIIKDRNMYLWYFVLFYFYGIFDAAVDAHLHDKRVKVRLTPLADPVDKKVSMNLSFGIQSRRK